MTLSFRRFSLTSVGTSFPAVGSPAAWMTGYCPRQCHGTANQLDPPHTERARPDACPHPVPRSATPKRRELTTWSDGKPSGGILQRAVLHAHAWADRPCRLRDAVLPRPLSGSTEDEEIAGGRLQL